MVIVQQEYLSGPKLNKIERNIRRNESKVEGILIDFSNLLR